MTLIAILFEHSIRCIALLSFVIIGTSCHPVDEADRFIEPWSSASEAWTSAFQNLKILKLSENPQIPHHLRGKRFVDPETATSNQLPNKSYQACIAPGNRKGHCKHVNHCILDEFRGNFARFMDYFCVIEQTYVGACCPDQAEVSEARTFNLNSMVGALLPVIADVNEDQPIWDSVKKTTVPDNDEYRENNVTTASIDWNNTSEETTQSTRQPRAPRGCGVNSNSPVRIHGGRPSGPQQWPWMVALLRQRTSQFCGGVLITDRHVLSAAHCVYRFKPSEITVRLGEYDFLVNDETRIADFQVVEIRQHDSFDPSTYVNDIAVLKMHKPTVFNGYIWPICLPPVGLNFENKSAIVAGWGTQWFGGPASTILMDVAVPVWPQRLCVRSFTQDIPDTAMCAGAFEGGRDSCQGDSGGPLLHQLGNGRWVTIGIVSWGIRCGEPNHPGVYTRVNSYLDWIFANVIF